MTLDELGLKYGTDKASNHHNYLHIYEKTFSPFRSKHGVFLEIGYGGFEDPDAGGESIKMWREWFSSDVIISCIDLYKKNVDPEIAFLKASQDDKDKIELFVGIIGKPSIIIDDASHLSSLTIKSFEILFPLLEPGGFYCIEDIHSSYHDWYYGRKEANANPALGKTAMNFFKRLADEVTKDLIEPQYHLGYEIDYITFYRDLVIIKKK